jgi:hypothetical protein
MISDYIYRLINMNIEIVNKFQKGNFISVRHDF